MTDWYYKDEQAGIYIACGDCREILPLIPDKSIDLVLTDPPYGVNKAEWDTELPLDIVRTFGEIAPVLGIFPGVANLLQYPRFIGELSYTWLLVAHLINGMKHGAIGFSNHIPCLVYSENGNNPYSLNTDCKDIVIGREPKPDHPSPKPVEAMMWFVERLSSLNDLILDPFMGSGTTLVSAKKLGRKAIGIEIEERYARIAVERLRQSVFNFEPMEPKPKQEQQVLL